MTPEQARAMVEKDRVRAKALGATVVRTYDTHEHAVNAERPNAWSRRYWPTSFKAPTFARLLHICAPAYCPTCGNSGAHWDGCPGGDAA